MDLEKRIDLIKEVGEEIITEEDLSFQERCFRGQQAA